MARVKISEYDAKRLLLPPLNHKFTCFAGTANTTSQELVMQFPDTNLVVKVDQGIKKRGKKGLVIVNCTPAEVVAAIKKWAADGWSHFLVEPMVEHAQGAEQYLALERMREGWQMSYGKSGGIDVESAWDSVTRTVLQRNSWLQAKKGSSADERTVLIVIEPLIQAMEQYHIVFLEMNPVLIRRGQLIPLDMAAEIDDAALGLPDIQPLGITPVEDKSQSAVEKAIAQLDAATPASLKFRLINPEGRIWMLLSGGGASLVLADEVADQGMGTELANYGEYSGAPTDDDVYSYTKLILSTMLQSKAPKLQRPMALVIAAGIANFTDVAQTFRGIIRALSEAKKELVRAKVKVFVRRGGPNEDKGLKMMGDFLTSAKIPHIIHHHETPITQVISEVKEYL